MKIIILDKALLTDLDYSLIFNMYHDDEKAFLFLDPPYTFSYNSHYESQSINPDTTQIIVNIYKFMKTCKCKVLMVVNSLDIVKYMFRKFIKGEYIKTYGIYKKNSKHIIISNY